MAMTQAKRSLLSLLALLVLAAGAGLFAYYGVHQKQEKEQAAKELEEKLFPDLDKAKVAQVTVTAKGQTTILGRTKGPPEGWSVVSPVNAAADKATIDSLLDRLAAMKRKALVEEKAADLARFGLEKPGVKVVVRLEDGKELALRVGEDISFDNTAYVATGDSAAVLQAEGGFKWALEKDTFDLRDKRVLPFEEGEAAGLDVLLDGERYSLKKAGAGWAIAAPITDKADEQVVNRILGALKNLRATRFLTDTASAADVDARGLGAPRLEATLTLTSGVRTTLSVGQADDGGAPRTYARRREATFIAEVPEQVFSELRVSPADLRDKTLLRFEKDKVAKASFAVGAESFTLERKKPEADAGAPSEDWAFTAPIQAEARKWKMSSVLWGLSSLKATGVVEGAGADLAKYGLDQPSRTVTLFDEAGKELGSLAFGREEGEKIYARNPAEPRIFEVDKARMGELPASRADLEEPKPAADAGTAP